MGKLGQRLSGSTLVEVLVAMVIILVVALIITTFFSTNYRQLNTAHKLKVMLVLNNEVDRIVADEGRELNVKEVSSINGLTVETVITESLISRELMNIMVLVKEADGRLVARRSVVCFRKKGGVKLLQDYE